MPYLVFKGSKYDRVRGNLALRRVKFFSIKNFRWRVQRENYIRRQNFYIITGGVGTGKTRELKKLEKWATRIWNKEAIYLNAKEGLTNWYKRAGLTNEELKGLKQFEKNELLKEALCGNVVLIDDIDGIFNKVKVGLLKEIIKNSSGGAVAFENPKKVHPAIIQILRIKQRLEPKEDLQVIDLGRAEEIVDIGMVVALALVVGLGLVYGFSEALLLALGLRWLVREGKN